MGIWRFGCFPSHFGTENLLSVASVQFPPLLFPLTLSDQVIRADLNPMLCRILVLQVPQGPENSCLCCTLEQGRCYGAKTESLWSLMD